MHDTLKYFARDPIDRKHHHGELTFRSVYAWTERFVMPLSHDEVVHGKGSLLRKMPGDSWQKLANLRLLYAYQWSLPGKKLLFMGCEFAQWTEWNHDASLDWHLLDEPSHRQIQLLIGELNRLYRSEPALHELDCEPGGFRWIVGDDAARSVLVYERIAAGGESIVCALNFTPVPRVNYRVGVAQAGPWSEILNTDAGELGGSGQGNLGGVHAMPVRAHDRAFSLNLTLPPLGAVFLRRARQGDRKR
jgi:1,4-alpha-glucan branching enzyme